MLFAGSYSQVFIAANASFGLVFRNVHNGACPVICACFCERSLVQQITYSIVEEYQADVIAIQTEMFAIGCLIDDSGICRHVQDIKYELAHLFRTGLFVVALSSHRTFGN